MPKGKIIKGIAGFYYIYVTGNGVYECKAKGIFRNKNIKPLIGDNVEIDILDDESKTGNIIQVLDRSNSLVRPSVANIDQAVIVFSAKAPKPNLMLLDKFLIATEKEKIHSIICFNKMDLDLDEANKYKEIYEKAGYEVVLTSTYKSINIEILKEKLYNKTNVFAGPSGVGKSSLLNTLSEKINVEIGEISQKIERGKHTTRHAELIRFYENSFVVDTPGFSSLNIEEIHEDELKSLFIEFKKHEDSCRFYGCNHLKEPDCSVKEAVGNGLIAESRYENYKYIFEEINNNRRW